jgi:hypothetical protein
MTRFSKPQNFATVDNRWDGPKWMPELSDRKDADKLAISKSDHAASFSEGGIRGILLVVQAYGREMYAVQTDLTKPFEEDEKGGPHLIPEHSGLWGKLEKVRVGAEVYIELEPNTETGELKHKTRGGHMSFRYNVMCDKKDRLAKPREDALKVTPFDDGDDDGGAAKGGKGHGGYRSRRDEAGDADLPF